MGEIAHLADLKPDVRNPNKGTQRGRGMVEASLRELGAGRSIVVDRDGNVIAGNKTLEAWADIADAEDVLVVKTKGDKLVVVQREDLDLVNDPRARKLSIADNRASEIGLDWDAEVLAAIQLDDDGALDGLFTRDELAEVLGDLLKGDVPEDAGAQIDRAEELRVKWGVELGQLWRLGEHRLICGDCTDRSVVERVMGGEKAALVVTSPPYWVEREYEQEVTEAEIAGHIARAADCMAVNAANDGRIIIDTMAVGRTKFSGGKREVDLLLDKWQTAFRVHGWLLRNVRIWQKEGGYIAFTAGQDMHDMHWEFLGTFWKEPRPQNQNKAAWVVQGMWDIQPQKQDVMHSAPFPVEIPERYMDIYTKRSDVVMEPYSGSGTTIIACERLGRRCRAVEISPAYCAVAIQRWADTTGGTPERID